MEARFKALARRLLLPLAHLLREGSWGVRVSRWWSRQGLPARAGALAAAGALIGIVAGAVLLLTAPGGGEGEPAAAVVVATATATATPTLTRTPSPPTLVSTETPTATPTAEPTAEPPAVVGTIQELAQDHGDPPDATLGRFRIPSLGVDAPLGTRFVGGDGVMPTPTGPADVVWYDLSEWTGLGGTPGGVSNAIFSGHVDYAAYVAYADVQFRGRGVFFHLGLLSPGDVIEVVVNGETLTYAVEWRRQVSANDADWAEIYRADLERDSITLITCGGDFDFTSREYADRVVVRAVRT